MTESSMDDQIGRSLRGLADTRATARPGVQGTGGGRVAATVLYPPVTWRGPNPRLSKPSSLPAGVQRRAARIARLGIVIGLLLGLAVATSTVVGLLDRPTLPRNLSIFGPPLTISGTSPGVTDPFELGAGEQRVEWYGWNEYGCRLDARLLSADGSSVSVVARAAIGRSRSGEVRLAALRAGAYRLQVDSTCAWSITFHGA
jgi:hypothetical protein